MKYRKVNQFLVCMLSASVAAGGFTGCGSRSSEQSVSNAAMTAESAVSEDAVSSSSGKEESKGSVEQGKKYLEDLDYDNAILEFRKVLRKDSKNVKALAGLYTALIAKGDRKEAEAVIAEAKAADIDENTMIEEVLDTADVIPDNDAANVVRNAIGTVALEDGYYELAEEAFTTVLDNDADNKDAANGLKQLEKKNKESEKKTSEKKKTSSEADNTDNGNSSNDSNAGSTDSTNSGEDGTGSPSESDSGSPSGDATDNSSGSGIDSSDESGSETSVYGESGSDADNAGEDISSSDSDNSDSGEGSDTSSSDTGMVTTTTEGTRGITDNLAELED